LDVRYAIAVLWPRTPILLVAAVLAGAVAFVGSGFLPPTYESRARMLVGQPSGIPPSAYEELLAAQILATTYAELGAATPVLEAALEASRVDVPLRVFEESVRVEPVRNSPLVEVICEYRSPEEAARMCNSMADEIAALSSGDEGQLSLVIIDPAEPGPSPVAPRPLTNGVAAGVAAVALVGGLILLFDRRPAGEP
jgi:capsular polysaccharide biosynthesis protein